MKLSNDVRVTASASQKAPVGAVVGRFQLFHNGHERLIREASKRCDTLLILVGSSQEYRTVKNPLSITERIRCINKCLALHTIANAIIIPVPDIIYDDPAWVANIAEIVESYGFEPKDIPLYCFDRKGDHDERSCMRPYFKVECMGSNPCVTSSTEVKRRFFTDPSVGSIDQMSPRYSVDYIRSLDLSEVQYEFNAAKDYEEKWQAAELAAPFPLPAFDCVDIIVRRNNQLLTVIRGEYPGKGKRAMPGGFVDKGESFKDAAIRELKEETGIKCDSKRVKLAGVFSAGERGGDRNTFVFMVDYDHCSGILTPQIGEVQKLEWVDLPKLGESGWFSDHAHIINRVIEEKKQWIFMEWMGTNTHTT